MTCLLDDVGGIFVVLVNAEGQHSLWSGQAPVPPGWAVMHAADTRQNCLDYIKQNWTDMRPASLKRSKSN